ncbi:keto-hydroxyglutarate-aldolase/keto-deoxy-phosphogluconate aldolase [Spiribacter salinus M19-40]|jgi:2-dehydro-3-deoxyphosphogluconate aldolase/(4S)-4-hydroxy-2-oxoglutarate aldolase|uniref:2-dehydro-3-deoxy-phosphogluconate aldolase n=1 Tax=Spiribacter salinus M19-40 TaxID=1260251 RepID=R4VEY3_9GAMM|nr:bifunctional 4-hydroxy-2-oxoglutarate aldolase/2-dehydro-3-deoxy-phosphogluconate aldolase [Spiribacter salinus]AGM40816.1 keto-hydroxyglutarate-aldolase/keto-deoxy-phosphogluconate aldolase [Spiribacter salinus M19-40]MBY5268048.1 keto-deoxy-phosphogluconate aldolase [Spiribacter salinus]MDR9414502.1 bifunctional 4-hydroxy-2-oxoglutarate aldolase/2-dehydro-3-deoxy-phosphogluconate aldolase [Spiribacter sp.]
MSPHQPVAMSFLMARAPVIPVLAIARVEDAVPLARALVAGGLPVLEITLRTPQALECVEAVASAVPEALVGVGTYTRSEQALAAREAGAQFLVSPGLSDALVSGAMNADLPFLPGVATASDVIRAQEAGYDHLKFFPAESSGGIEALKALGGPFGDVRFCPTGGIGPTNCLDYLSLPNVLCVGGSWVAPASAVAAGDWERVTGLAAAVTGHYSASDWYSVAGEEDPGSGDEKLR